MEIKWNPQKAEDNFRKHEVRFSDAEFGLFDPMTLTIEDQIIDQEQAFYLLVLTHLVGCYLLSIHIMLTQSD